MRTLYLSPRQSVPLVSGAKLRDFHLAKALGEAGELTYVHYSEPDLAPPVMPFAKRVITVPRPRPYSPAKILRGLTGRWPLPIVNYTSPAMAETLRELLRARPFDLVHVDAIHMAGCAWAVRDALAGTPVMYNWHNIESEYLERYANENPSTARRWYARHAASQMYGVETAILESARGHIVCSNRELELLSARAPRARLAVIENGVEMTKMSAPRSFDESRNRILFVGSMAYPANAHAAVWFCREIWPAIQKRYPQFRLTIVGYNPLPEVLALRESGVEVTGTVPDVLAWYAQAFAAIVPVRIAGGTRLKILEAMAVGVPVLSTRLGAEGLDVSHGRDILLVESADEWVDALTQLTEPAHWMQLASAGQGMVRERYDWEVIGRKLLDVYKSWL